MEIDDNEEEHIKKMEESLIKDQKEEDNEVLEFCDLCDMELEHHPDNQPCPPDETYVKEFKTCPICDKIQPTREHVAKPYIMDQNLIQLKRSALLAKTKNITTNDKKINTN